MTDETVRMTMLFDYYGELLTEKQREYCDLRYNEDLSLAEIAEQSGTSRQAVWDIIRRSANMLIEYEEKTGLVRRAEERKKVLASVKTELLELSDMLGGDAKGLCADIIEKLQAID